MTRRILWLPLATKSEHWAKAWRFGWTIRLLVHFWENVSHLYCGAALYKNLQKPQVKGFTTGYWSQCGAVRKTRGNCGYAGKQLLETPWGLGSNKISWYFSLKWTWQENSYTFQKFFLIPSLYPKATGSVVHLAKKMVCLMASEWSGRTRMPHRSHHESQVIGYTCNLCTSGRLRKEDNDFKVSLNHTEFEVTLGYIFRQSQVEKNCVVVCEKKSIKFCLILVCKE